MERFGYIRAASIPEAVALLHEPGLRSRPLAGGTDLLLLARGNPDLCDRGVDISLVPELHAIRQQGEQVVIGAAATFSEVIENPLVARTAPLLVQACRMVGAVQVRNMGTLGGNVVNAAACADSLPALVCLEAVARVVTPQSEFEWPVSDMVLGPNRTRIPPGGLLVSLSYPIPPAGSRSIFLKLGRRGAMAISRLTVAALGRLDERSCIAETRLVPGAAAPQTRRFASVEAFLAGKPPQAELFRQAGELAAEEMVQRAGRRWSSEYKEPALAALVARALSFIFDLPENHA